MWAVTHRLTVIKIHTLILSSLLVPSVVCHRLSVRYDTIEEFKVDSKAEYTA